MHAPRGKPHMPPGEKPHMPPGEKPHMLPPGATTHAPSWSNHACPPGATTYAPHEPRTPSLLTESQTPVKI